jgi:hypothetical protein
MIRAKALSPDALDAERFSGWQSSPPKPWRLTSGGSLRQMCCGVRLDADGKIAEVTIWWRPLPAGVALQRNLADALGMQPWELRTEAE